MASSKELSVRRKWRTRSRIKKRATDRPRLSVFRSGKHIYAQVINDADGKTEYSASTVEKEFRKKKCTSGDAAAAGEIGKLVAERALAGGVKEVVFDRGGYKYHGRVKALAEAARKAGLTF